MQDVFLFSRTIGENISLHDENIDINTIKEAANAWCKRVYRRVAEPVYGASFYGARGNTLSFGRTKQLISFCRAYAADPGNYTC